MSDLHRRVEEAHARSKAWSAVAMQRCESLYSSRHARRASASGAERLTLEGSTLMRSLWAKPGRCRITLSGDESDGRFSIAKMPATSRLARHRGQADATDDDEAHDFMPVWSNDGKQLAFASDRYGNFDVFVMPATGGEAKRLTYHSAGDMPCDFSPDGQRVIFSANRRYTAANAQFPRFSQLYSVPSRT